jgi:hypothetical protein
MKQLLFLLLFPCLALAQYPNNGNQKITLGEQTTADGLVYRGVANDTNIITPFSDTSAYIILDTIDSKFYHYNRTTTYWALAGGGGGSTLDTATMLLPYYRAGRNGIIQVADVPTLNQNTTGSAATLTTARNIRTNLASAYGANFDGSANITPGVMGVLGAGNGGTGASNFGSPNRIPFVSSSGSLTTDTFFAYNGTTQRLGVGVPNPTEKLHVSGNGLFTGSMSLGTPLTVANGGTGQTTLALAGINTGSGTLNYLPKYTSTGTTLGNSLIYDNGSTIMIGTTTPLGGLLLQLTGANSRIGMLNNSADNTINYSQMFFGNGGGVGQYAEFYRQNNTKRFHIFNDGGDLGLSTRFSSGYIYDIYLNTSGNVGIGTTSPAEKLHVVGNARITAVGAGTFANNLNITSDGTLTTATSDEKYKYNILPITYGLNTILQLNPVNFQWIKGEENDLGFIAQDVAEIIPEAVNTNWNSDLLMRYESIIPILTKAIQEQQAQIEALKQRIINLENK